MDSLSTDAIELLRALAIEVQALRRMLEADRQGVAAGADAALVHAVYAVAGSREFRAAELHAMAERPGTPEAALRALLGGRSNKATGKLLAGAARRPCPDTGVVLLHTPSRRGGTWRIAPASQVDNV